MNCIRLYSLLQVSIQAANCSVLSVTPSLSSATNSAPGLTNASIRSLSSCFSFSTTLFLVLLAIGTSRS